MRSVLKDRKRDYSQSYFKNRFAIVPFILKLTVININHLLHIFYV